MSIRRMGIPARDKSGARRFSPIQPAAIAAASRNMIDAF
jgi:hypothetical protein